MTEAITLMTVTFNVFVAAGTRKDDITGNRSTDSHSAPTRGSNNGSHASAVVATHRLGSKVAALLHRPVSIFLLPHNGHEMRHVSTLESTPAPDLPVSERIVYAIADRKEVSPLDVSPPLFDAVDPDALDRLYANGRTGTAVTFEYSGYRVRLDEAGRVELTPLSG